MRNLLRLLEERLVNRFTNYNPSDYPNAPRPDQNTKQRKAATPSVLPKDVDYDPVFKNLVRSVYSDNLFAFELEVYKPEAKKKANSFELTENEIVVLNEKQLDILKAKRLKPYWCDGLSSQKVAKTLTKEVGYSWATIKKYWAVFNANAPTPIENEK